MSMGFRSSLVALACGALFSGAVLAQDAAAPAAAEESPSPLQHGPYIAPMASYIFTDDKAFDDGYGGTLAAGYRKGWWAVEASGLYGDYQGAHGEKSTDAIGGTINGLLFPFSGASNFFALLGAGGLDIDRHPAAHKEYSLTTFEGGLGYIFALSSGNYDWGIRADARYRYGHRESRVEPEGDIDVDHDFADVLVNLGLQLPLGLRQPPPPPAAPAVVPVADSDGDGVLDDADQCPGTPPGTAVDAKGCPLPPPAPPCKTPEVGEKISMGGCGTGDVIVLRGVNFDFDKSKLTPNAATILDNVASELKAYPSIQVEIGGHTDSLGSDAYNQRLSEARASSVKTYLTDAGVDGSRMTTAGYGEAQPVADNETEEGRALNRRVELKVTAGVAATGDAAAPAEAPAADAVPAADAAAAPAEGEAPAEAPAEPAAPSAEEAPAATP
jgi:outer membrane protein OmpA-like peptidoglycan-associated protein